MKILILGPAFPLRGGIAHLNESLCRAFIKEGDSAEIVSFSLQYPSFLFPEKHKRKKAILQRILPFTQG
jgi:D-inositol-3-phosphate glycosyltransferase